MFETSVVRARAQAAGRLRMLTISVIAHSAVIIGAVAMSIASIEFPTTAPDQYALAPIPVTFTPPPPLGTPEGSNRPQPAQQPARPAEPQPQPNQITAPPTVPDDVPVLDAASTATGPIDNAGEGGGTASGPPGQPWGVDGGIGDLNAPPAVVAAPPVEQRIYQAHEVTAPVALFKPAPPYPQTLLKTKLKATVIVRCIIDKNGRVRDAEILKNGPMAPFDKSVLDTVTTWRYTPGSLNGIAVDTYLNVTVHFSVN